MTKITKPMRLHAGEAVDLKQRATLIEPMYASKAEYAQLQEAHGARLDALQQRLYAANTHAILIIFQGMDAAGKDGCIKHVMSGLSPLGCQAFSFSEPSPAEHQHDFLWRTTRNLPERGRIGIFNRSYYEDVLITRVHPDLLAAQGLGDEASNEKFWNERYRSITGLERHLHANATRIVKIFLHISKEEQRRRLLERIDIAQKNWKIKPSDIEERKYWKLYRQAYEACFTATSTRDAPWYVVPADDKMTARLLVSHIVLDVLEGLEMTFPKSTPQHIKALAGMRKQLEQEGDE